LGVTPELLRGRDERSGCDLEFGLYLLIWLDLRAILLKIHFLLFFSLLVLLVGLGRINVETAQVLLDQPLFFLELHLHGLYLLLLILERIELVLLQRGVRNAPVCLIVGEVLRMH
jgi:hypothetical protein